VQLSKNRHRPGTTKLAGLQKQTTRKTGEVLRAVRFRLLSILLRDQLSKYPDAGLGAIAKTLAKSQNRLRIATATQAPAPVALCPSPPVKAI
jgi:hypothetical protein